MPKKTINRRKKQSNKRNKSKSKKSRYSSIAKKIDKVIDSYFKKDKKTKKNKKKTKKKKKKSGTKSGPFSKRNPRVELNIEKKELEEIEKDILENTDPLIKEANILELDASKQTKIVANFVKQKIANDLLESRRILNKDNSKENQKKFLYNSLLFWKMCDNYPKTEICIGKNSKEKIKEYMEKLNLFN